MHGILLATTTFALFHGLDRLGRSRDLDAAAIGVLDGLSNRYAGTFGLSEPRAEVLAIGRELFRWLDGDGGDLQALINGGPRPFHFEVRSSTRSPSAAEWAMLRAPWELLADDNGFLAEDVLLQFSPFRRLGQPSAATALGEYRLGLMFMAAAPRGGVELDFEAEEAAILRAVGDRNIDLLVEESGTLDDLGESLRTQSKSAPMQVLHLSCHGQNHPEPELLLEDGIGQAKRAKVSDILPKLRPAMPRLVFLSACLTATSATERRAHRSPAEATRDGGTAASAAAVVHSFASSLIEGGVPAVIGWDGSVTDRAASLFAEQLYDRLSGWATLADAVADARRKILGLSDPALRNDWHLARLWLGPDGGGSLVAGQKQRFSTSNTQLREFLDLGRRRVEVASHEMFVGRRRDLQTAIACLRDNAKVGVIIHGLGQQGKSSLAHRVALRLRGLKLAVVFGHYQAGDVIDVLRDALGTNVQARRILDEGRQAVNASPTALGDVVRDLLSGPCRDHGDGQTPLLLVIDDLERILVADPAGKARHTLTPPHGDVLRQIIEAFGQAGGASRLLITSRFPFRLGGLEQKLQELPLSGLSEAARLKLIRRQIDLATSGTNPNTVDRTALLARAQRIGRGHAGLQSLLGETIVLDPQLSEATIIARLDEAEAWIDKAVAPADAILKRFADYIKLGTLLDEAGSTACDLLRALTVFGLPVPEAVIDAVATAVGGSPTRLVDLGLLERHADLVDVAQWAFIVSDLARGRLDPLADAEVAALASVAAPILFVTWTTKARWAASPIAGDIEVGRLGLIGSHVDSVEACSVQTLRSMTSEHAETRLRFAEGSVRLIEQAGREVPLRLLAEAANAAATAGDGEGADRFLQRAEGRLEHLAGNLSVSDMQVGHLFAARGDRLQRQGRPEGAIAAYEGAERIAIEAKNEINAAIARGKIADVRYHQGDYAEVMRIRREVCLPIFERLGDQREIAVCWGKIADVLYQQGDYAEVLRIRREICLPVYERLGDQRSIAVTWGKIADVLYSQGDTAEVLRIRREVCLPIFERLGDQREAAVTWSKIADVLYSQGDYTEVLRIRREVCLPIYERLGDQRSIAVTWGKIADVLYSQGDYTEVLRIRREVELPVYERLGDQREIAVCWGKIADVLYNQGDTAEVLRIRREVELPVYERLGDQRGIAVCWGQIADVLYQQGDYDEVLRIRREVELPVYERLGDQRSIAICWGQIADVLYRQGDYAEVLRICREVELPVYERLGDQRSIAVTWGQIADVLHRQGDYAEVLRIRREVCLPIYERLGDQRGIAVTWGKIADVLHQQGDYAEVLRIRREVELPVYERLGDQRGIAVCWGKIADVLHRQGDLDGVAEFRAKQLDVARDMGDRDTVANAQWGLAQIALNRDDMPDAFVRMQESFMILLELGRADGLAVVGGLFGRILLQGGLPDEGVAVLRIAGDAFRKIGALDQANEIEALLDGLDDEDSEEKSDDTDHL